jgi:predicted porin
LKKSIHCIIAIVASGALASAAQAQTAVTVYGNIDAGVMTQSKTSPSGTGGRDTNFVEGILSPSYYGLKGSEDLGGGLTAAFVLEGGFSSANGTHANPGVYQTQIFGRQAAVTLSGDWGTLGAGMQVDPAFIAAATTEPRGMADSFSALDLWTHATVGNNYAGGGSLQGMFDDNALTYTYAKNGLYIGLEYGFGGVAGSTSANATQSIGLAYKNSGFTVSASYETDNNLNPAVGGNSSQVTAFGLAYAWDDFAVRTQYGDYKANPSLMYELAANVAIDDNIQSWGIGFDWKSSVANKINLSYYDAKDTAPQFGGRTTEIALMDTYYLSKHTYLFGQVVNLNVAANAGLSAGLGGFYVSSAAYTASAGTSTLYLGAGVNHSF